MNIQEAAYAQDIETLESASSPELMLGLGAIADEAPEGDMETLHAMDAIIVELTCRDIDRPSRQWLERIHTGVLGQLS